ncbi:MAG: hypothetical protein BWX84_02254 [Verrucomicrobia bacterium ADurb.Bin118]|nr:MAG: hypothetical protein BWX84_02254 [Verrucomicrobia bacterium ADurb.Bin118]
MFTGQLPAHFHPGLMHVASRNGAVRPREIDVFKHAQRPGLWFWRNRHAVNALVIDDHDFARLDVAHELGVDEIEGTGLAGEHPGILHAAQGEWAKTVRIPHPNEFPLGQNDERERALNPPHRLAEGVRRTVVIRLRQQVQNDFAVGGGLED